MMENMPQEKEEEVDCSTEDQWPPSMSSVSSSGQQQMFMEEYKTEDA